jgi:integrase
MLYKRGNVWWFRIKFHGSEVRESAGTNSKTVARKIELRRRRDLEEGAGGIRRGKPRLFRAAAEDWLAMKRSTLAPKSIAIEDCNLKHLLPYFGAILCSEIEAADIARYQQRRKAEGAASGTINLEVSTVRAVLRRLGFWARLQPETRMLPEREDVGRALTLADEARLLRSAAESRSRALYPAILVSLNTGLRYGELTGLRWSQVELSRRRLTVGKSKTRAGTGRIVPLNDRAFSVLSMWASRFPTRADEHFVFPSEKYGQPRKTPVGSSTTVYFSDPTTPIGRLKEAWEEAKRRTEDEEKRIPAVVCRWHDLRHTFLTRLVEGGTPLPRLSVIMGWSPATTARMAKRYGHVAVDALRQDVGLLDRVEIDSEGAQKGAQSEQVATPLVS